MRITDRRPIYEAMEEFAYNSLCSTELDKMTYTEVKELFIKYAKDNLGIHLSSMFSEYNVIDKKKYLVFLLKYGQIR